MTPYYQDQYVTIIHADCRDILPQIEPVDLVLTDPPYTSLKGGLDIKPSFATGVTFRREGLKTIGLPWGDNLQILRLVPDVAKMGAFIFCSFKGLVEIQQLIDRDPIALVTWYTRNRLPSINNVPNYSTEFIWAFKFCVGGDWRKLQTMYDILRLTGGCMATERFQELDGTSSHPTQKPIALIKSLLAVGGDIILDPFMGSGTTLRAAKDLRRKAIGIEIEEKYCEIAAKRMAQEVLPL